MRHLNLSGAGDIPAIPVSETCTEDGLPSQSGFLLALPFNYGRAFFGPVSWEVERFGRQRGRRGYS